MYFNNVSPRNISSGFHQGANFFKTASHVSRHIVHHPIMKILPHDVQKGMHKTAEHIETVSNRLERTKHILKPIEEHVFKFH